MSRAERVLADYRTVGLSVEGHPMEFLREELRARGVLSAAEVNERFAGEEVEVAGVAICRQRPRTAKGVLFVTLEDETGLANFVVLHDVQERYRRELFGSPLLRLVGVVEREDGVVNVRVTRAGQVRIHKTGDRQDPETPPDHRGGGARGAAATGHRSRSARGHLPEPAAEDLPRRDFR